MKTLVLAFAAVAVTLVACSSDETSPAGGPSPANAGASGAGGSSAGAGGSAGGGFAGSDASGGSAGQPASGEPIALAPIPAALDAACTGKLLVEAPIFLRTSLPGDATGDNAPVGTVILLARFGSAYEGVVLLADGRTGSVKPSVLEQLQLGTHFASDCATDDAPRVPTLLVEARVYPKADLSGQACVLAQGTTFTSLSVSDDGAVAAIESDTLTGACGFAKGWAAAFEHETLVVRK